MDDTGIKGLEEERRLAYVAITRGRRRVVLSHASSRRMFGNYSPSSPSRFIAELPEEGVTYLASTSGAQRAWGPSRDNWAPRKAREPMLQAESRIISQNTEGGLGVGQRVFHDKFGYGRIKNSEGNGEQRKLTVAFDKAGEKKLLATLANLRAV